MNEAAENITNEPAESVAGGSAGGSATAKVLNSAPDKDNKASGGSADRSMAAKVLSTAPNEKSTASGGSAAAEVLSTAPNEESTAPNEKSTVSDKERAEIMRLNRRIADLNVARKNDAAINDYRRWMKEAEAVKAEYPDFDIEAEAKDARFASLLKSGIDVRSAYIALHSDDIIAASLEKARAGIAADILRRSARPRENGTVDQSASVGKPDISSLSRSEIEAIERRVARGEKIYLK